MAIKFTDKSDASDGISLRFAAHPAGSKPSTDEPSPNALMTIELDGDLLLRKPEKPLTLRRGRPAKHGDEPWVAAGISRRTWFRRQKAKG